MFKLIHNSNIVARADFILQQNSTNINLSKLEQSKEKVLGSKLFTDHKNNFHSKNKFCVGINDGLYIDFL